MDAKLKADWVKELRSDKFKQGRGSLFSRGCHCCLGVLCEVSGVGISQDGSEPLAAGEHTDTYRVFDDLLGVSDVAATLWWMNDREGKTFQEIADWIVEHIPSDEQSEPSHG